MHFWGVFSMLLLAAIFFSGLIAEIVIDWVRKEYLRLDGARRLDRELDKHEKERLKNG